MTEFLIGFAVCAVIAGAVWMYRAWIVAEATTVVTKTEQKVKDTVAKI